MSHPTDAAGQRDLKAENELIHSAMSTPAKVPIVQLRTKINFTSLAQAKIPNFAIEKILGANVQVTYVPDLYYILSLSQKMFIAAKQDKSLSKIDTLSVYSFTLYMCYSLMYVYLDTVQQVNPSYDLTHVLQLFSRNGYDSVSFPSLVSTWINGLGKYTDIDTSRIFVPYLPDPVTDGDYYDNHFLSPDTAHLLPNFRLLHLIILHQGKNTPLQIPQIYRNANKFVGNPMAAIGTLSGIRQARQNVYRSPGAERLFVSVEDPQLYPLLLSNLNKTHSDPLERYLMLDSTLLIHLKLCVEPLFREIDIINLSSVSQVGTSFTMLPIVMDIDQDDKIDPLDTDAVPTNAVAEEISISGVEYNARIKSRSEIFNGNVDYAALTPLVRVSTCSDAIIIGNYTFVDPQHNWYTESIEFQTRSFTINEAQTYFTRTS